MRLYTILRYRVLLCIILPFWLVACGNPPTPYATACSTSITCSGEYPYTCGLAESGICYANRVACEQLTLCQTPTIPPTGTAIQVGSTAAGFGVSENSPTGLASIDSTLYMVGTDTDALYALDTTTGMATRMGSVTQFGINEADPTSLGAIGNTLYLVGRSKAALYTLDTATGAATQVGTAIAFDVNEVDPTGLASIGRALYMVGNDTDALYALDTTTGMATRMGSAVNFAVGERMPADLAAIGNVLYLVGGDSAQLYMLNTMTGAATAIGFPTAFGVGEITPRGLAALGNALYLVGQHTAALYTVVHTMSSAPPGTAIPVGAVVASTGGAVNESEPIDLAAIGDTLYLVGDYTDRIYTIALP